MAPHKASMLKQLQGLVVNEHLQWTNSKVAFRPAFSALPATSIRTLQFGCNLAPLIIRLLQMDMLILLQAQDGEAAV